MKNVTYIELGEDIMKSYSSDPVGFLYSHSAYRSDSSICNSGFYECFYQTLEEFLPTIEFFRRLKALKMIIIFKSVAYYFKNNGCPPDGMDELPDNFFDDFIPLSEDLEKLNDIYYEERNNLPGFDPECSGYLTAVIGFYKKHYPEDFTSDDETDKIG